MHTPLIIPAILGPTASGKSDLALRLAARYSCEIISCDSRQVYRGLDIGTAKPSPSERRAVPHHGIDVADIAEEYSAFRYAGETAALIRERSAAGARLILCGGTGFYYQALMNGAYADAGFDPAFREDCMRRARQEGGEVLHKELALVDPVSAARLHRNDLARVIRALHVFRETGLPLSQHEGTHEIDPQFSFRPFVLELPRELLYQRINERVGRMAKAGLYEEFRSLCAAGYGPQSPGLRTVGYQELFAVAEGTLSLDEALDMIRQSSRRYAKRQMTWFRGKTPGETLAAADPDTLFEDCALLFEQELFPSP